MTHQCGAEIGLLDANMPNTKNEQMKLLHNLQPSCPSLLETLVFNQKVSMMEIKD